jgi:hypothetical protein
LRKKTKKQWWIRSCRFSQVRKKSWETMTSQEAYCHLWQHKKNQHQGFFPWLQKRKARCALMVFCVFFLFFLSYRNQWWVGRLVIVFYNARNKNRRQGWGALVIVFYPGFIRSDALLSSLLNSLKGPSVLNCENMELGGAPDFQH